MEMHQILIVIFFISSPLVVSAWDVAVAVRNEIKFLNNSGHVITTVSESMVELQALTYSPEQQLFFYSDNSLTNGSIFSFKVSNDQADNVTYTDLRAVVSEQNEIVQNIAYDHKTQILYWTNGFGHQIKWLKLGSTTPQPGQILYQSGNKLLAGLAIDSCKRYLYWTTCLLPSGGTSATIERSLLDGSKREILISDDLYQPLGIVLDQDSQRMFWIDEYKNNVVYKIESATFTGQDRRTIIHGSHHKPFSVTISHRFVFWTDRTNTAIWKLPIDANSDTEPVPVLDVDLLPTGLTTFNHLSSSSDLNLECNPVVEPKIKIINATIETVSPATLDVAEKLSINVSSYCLNQGLLREPMICDCPPRYSGFRCEIDICHNYCLNGVCEVDSAGLPKCRKCTEGWTGDRCEIDVCENYCVRGKCLVENLIHPKCYCSDGWSGERCEIWHLEKQKLEKNVAEVCQSYCKLYTSSGQQQDLHPLENCRCSLDVTDSSVNSSAGNDVLRIGEMREACMWNEINEVVLLTLGLLCIILLMLVAVLTRKVFTLRKRPRIKKRIIVSKTTTPLTCRPQPEQCEITIENCCNMNICETPCFEPEFRTPCATLTKNGKKKEENKSLLGNIELPPDDLY